MATIPTIAAQFELQLMSVLLSEVGLRFFSENLAPEAVTVTLNIPDKLKEI